MCGHCSIVWVWNDGTNSLPDVEITICKWTIRFSITSMVPRNRWVEDQLRERHPRSVHMCESALADSHIHATSLPRLSRPLDRLTSFNQRHLSSQTISTVRTSARTTYVAPYKLVLVFRYKLKSSWPENLHSAPQFAPPQLFWSVCALRANLALPLAGLQSAPLAFTSAVSHPLAGLCLTGVHPLAPHWSAALSHSPDVPRLPRPSQVSVARALLPEGVQKFASQDAFALASPQLVALAQVWRTLITRRYPSSRFRSSMRLILLEAAPAYDRNRFPGFPSTAVDHRLLWPRFSPSLSPRHSLRQLPELIAILRDHTVAHRPLLLASSAKAHHLSSPSHQGALHRLSPTARVFTASSTRFPKKEKKFSFPFGFGRLKYCPSNAHVAPLWESHYSRGQRQPTATSAYLGHCRRPLRYAILTARLIAPQEVTTSSHPRMAFRSSRPSAILSRKTSASNRT